MPYYKIDRSLFALCFYESPLGMGIGIAFGHCSKQKQSWRPRLHEAK